MRTEVVLLILGMSLVTYIPRALPAVLLEKLRLNANMEKFLKMIPYTAMAALVFPGILSVDAGKWYVGVIGGLAAVLLAWRKLSVAVVVLGSVAAVLGLYLIL